MGGGGGWGDHTYANNNWQRRWHLVYNPLVSPVLAIKLSSSELSMSARPPQRNIMLRRGYICLFNQLIRTILPLCVRPTPWHLIHVCGDVMNVVSASESMVTRGDYSTPPPPPTVHQLIASRGVTVRSHSVQCTVAYYKHRGLSRPAVR